MPELNRHGPAAGCMPDGIRQQVADRAADHQCIAHHDGLALERQAHTLFLGGQAVKLDQAAERLAEVVIETAAHP